MTLKSLLWANFLHQFNFFVDKKKKKEKENGALLHLLDEYYNNFLMKISSLLSREIILIPMWKGPLLALKFQILPTTTLALGRGRK